MDYRIPFPDEQPEEGKLEEYSDNEKTLQYEKPHIDKNHSPYFVLAYAFTAHAHFGWAVEAAVRTIGTSVEEDYHRLLFNKVRRILICL